MSRRSGAGSSSSVVDVESPPGAAAASSLARATALRARSMWVWYSASAPGPPWRNATSAAANSASASASSSGIESGSGPVVGVVPPVVGVVFPSVVGVVSVGACSSGLVTVVLVGSLAGDERFHRVLDREEPVARGLLVVDERGILPVGDGYESQPREVAGAGALHIDRLEIDDAVVDRQQLQRPHVCLRARGIRAA